MSNVSGDPSTLTVLCFRRAHQSKCLMFQGPINTKYLMLKWVWISWCVDDDDDNKVVTNERRSQRIKRYSKTTAYTHRQCELSQKILVARRHCLKFKEVY
ncbi:hypothetical protein BsWGS_25283 [Bradybaena similaris]